MANQINTRIRLKYDSYANWQEKNPVLLSGEIAIAYLGQTRDENGYDKLQEIEFEQHPVLFKVGPGNFNSLPWASALAADVYSWAKSEKVEYNTANQKIEFKNGSTVVKSLDLSTLATKTITGDLTKLNTTNKTDLVTAINEALQAVEVGGTGSVVTVVKTTNGNGGSYEVKQGGNKVGDTITVPDAYTKTEANNTFAPKNIDTGVHSVSLASGTNNGTLKLTVDGSATDNIAVKGLGDAAYTTVSSLNTTAKGYADAVENKLGDLALKDTISEGDITGTIGKDKITNFANEVAAVKVTNAGTADKVAHSFTVNGVAFDGSADQSVTISADSLGLESAMHFVGALTEAPASANPGDVYLNTATKKEYVYAEGQGWVELGDEGSHALKDVKIQAANGLEVTAGGTLAADTTIGIKNGGVTTDHIAANAVTTAKIANDNVTVDKLASNAVTTAKIANANVTTDKVADKAITEAKLSTEVQNKLNKAAPVGTGTVAIATNNDGVVTLNGGVKLNDHTLEDDTSKADITLAKVATSGSIYDLNEVKTTDDATITGGDYLIFYCGSAEDVI